MKKIQQVPLVIAVIVLLQACVTISPFSETAYKMATGLKAESLALMDKATDDYSSHTKAIDTLKIELEKAFEYAKSRPLNEVSTNQWRIMIDPNRNLLGGFLQRWQSETKLQGPFVVEAKKVVSETFDKISELESGKRKSQ